MLIFIKKRNLFLLVGILFFGILGLGLALRQPMSYQEAAAVPGYGRRIVLDAGHGEPDGGTVGSSGVLEKDLNLKITLLLQGYLEQSGMEVVLTRTGDEGIYDADSKTIRQKKRTDLYNREKIMNQSAADIFVSIHMNQFSDSQYSGPQVFYSPNTAAAQQMAECVQKTMNDMLQPAAPREVKRAGREIYLLKQAKIPAVLIECGFLSNKHEEQLLQVEDYQKQVAWAIYCGLIQYFA